MTVKTKPREYPSEILSKALQDYIVDQATILTLGSQDSLFDPHLNVVNIIRAVEREWAVKEKTLKGKK